MWDEAGGGCEMGGGGRGKEISSLTVRLKNQLMPIATKLQVDGF